MSAADFVDNTEFFMQNLLEPKNNKNGPFFVEFWQYLNVGVSIRLIMIAVTFRTHSSPGTKQAGTGVY